MARASPPHVRLDTSLESLLERLVTDPLPKVLATVVATAGSTYRKPGARMLIFADGSCHGLLSGGCLEADLSLHAAEVLRSGTARSVEYDMRGPDDVLFGIGAGCEGAMRVLLEPAGPGSLAQTALVAAGGSTRVGRTAALVTVHESTSIALGTYLRCGALPVELAAATHSVGTERSREVTIGEPGRFGRAFLHCLAPSPHLLVCGAGPDAEPVARTALALGWRVSVVDHRAAYVVAARFPGANIRCGEPGDLSATVDLAGCHAAVVMSHHLPSDVAYLRALAEAGAPGFVGLLGPQARRQRIALELGDATCRLQARICGPVGLDIGALTPESIALAIVSQIHAWLAGRFASIQVDSDCAFAHLLG